LSLLPFNLHLIARLNLDIVYLSASVSSLCISSPPSLTIVSLPRFSIIIFITSFLKVKTITSASSFPKIEYASKDYKKNWIFFFLCFCAWVSTQVCMKRNDINSYVVLE
jgi:hypothetical protein